MIYADNAATTKMSRTAVDAMLPYMDELYGNPSSLYAFGQEAKEALEDAREQGIKKNQDAEIVLALDGNLIIAWEDGAYLSGFDEADLATLFIVSKVTVEQRDDEAPGMRVSVKLSEAPKCPRCWNHDASIGTSGHHDELCDRCAHVLESEQ